MRELSSHKILSIGERAIALSGLLLWFIFSICYFNSESILLKGVFGFPLLVVFPGFLFLLTIRYSKTFSWLYLAATVGSSLIILMIYGLAVNMALPIFGIVPLVGETLVFSFFGLLSVLSLIPIYRNSEINFPIIPINKTSYALLGASFLTVILSIIGALRLNNQLGPEVALFNLYLIGAVFILVLINQTRLSGAVLCGIFYLKSLALLLMTSLRGWDIVGHDIQREFNVFQMTHNAGVWSINYLLDAYNACLSITILPTILAELLSTPDVYIYKLLFQIIFALVPVVSFIVISRYFPPYVAITATFLIIAFPTFYTDMPMLNRQEIAFLMFMLLISTLLDSELNQKVRSFLIVFFGIGIVLSHYSTTYIVIIFLLTAWFGYWFLKISLKFSAVVRLLGSTKILLNSYEVRSRASISFLALSVIILFSFAWSNQFTQTSDDSIKRVLMRTYEALLMDSESSRSSDTRYSLFAATKMTPEEVVAEYKDNFVSKVRSEAEEGTFYSEEVIANFNPTIVEEARLPETRIGKYIESFGIDVTDLNHLLKFGSARALQLFLLLGMVMSLFMVRYFVKKPPVEYLLLSGAGVVFLAAMVVIPVLSVEYGVLRAFQQSLFITAPYVVIGMLGIMILFGEKFGKFFAASFILVFFFASSGAITQTLGGYKALLHLNNSGPYYDYYYIHNSEVRGLLWLNEQAEKSEQSNFQSEVQTDRYVSKKINERSKVQSVNEIFPGLTRRNSYVFLGYANVRNGTATIYYSGMNVNFIYPKSLIDVYKNKVYESEGVVIYR